MESLITIAIDYLDTGGGTPENYLLQVGLSNGDSLYGKHECHSTNGLHSITVNRETTPRFFRIESVVWASATRDAR